MVFWHPAARGCEALRPVPGCSEEGLLLPSQPWAPTPASGCGGWVARAGVDGSATERGVRLRSKGDPVTQAPNNFWGRVSQRISSGPSDQPVSLLRPAPASLPGWEGAVTRGRLSPPPQSVAASPVSGLPLRPFALGVVGVPLRLAPIFCPHRRLPSPPPKVPFPVLSL